MLYRFQRLIKRMGFNHQIRDIVKTDPIRIVNAPWMIFSMVGNRDVPMFLLSMKSFYARLQKGKLTVIVDHDMPEPLRDVIRHHFIGVEFVELETLDPGRCQRGGTWERLVHRWTIRKRNTPFRWIGYALLWRRCE